jgi:small-conductance mechanosensitive channel
MPASREIAHLPYCPRHRLLGRWLRELIDRFRDIARALVAVLLLGIAGAAAQTAQSPTSPNPGAAPQAGSTLTAQAPAQPASPAGPQINIAEITARANRDVGINIETAIAGWQHELDRLESNLKKPRLRYSELNDLRDELQRSRAGVEDFWHRLKPPLAATKDQVDLLGSAPAAGQPPEPEHVALNRAELNYRFGLLSAGQAAVHSTNLRIDHLINTIQDIRRKNFTTSLFQPVPGIYSYQTWAKLPDYVPSATSRARDLMVVVGGEEGRVCKISVRSTEVETSERAHVLIPNSYFITEKVKNWTLRDSIRRIVIPVSVGYGCDARKVRAALLKVAQDNPDVMTTPAPSVDFDFGGDTLNFKLYAFIYDLNKGGSTSTDLRFAILDAFNEAGISIPSRQTDATPRSMDWLHEPVAEHISGPSNGTSSGNGKPAARPLSGPAATFSQSESLSSSGRFAPQSQKPLG